MLRHDGGNVDGEGVGGDGGDDGGSLPGAGVSLCPALSAEPMPGSTSCDCFFAITHLTVGTKSGSSSFPDV